MVTEQSQKSPFPFSQDEGALAKISYLPWVGRVPPRQSWHLKNEGDQLLGDHPSCVDYVYPDEDGENHHGYDTRSVKSHGRTVAQFRS